MSEFFALPPQDTEYRLALRLLNQTPPLDRQILDALVGRPKRYKELRPLLDGRNDNVLNKALRRLRDDGLIQSGLDLDAKQKTYRLTALGKLALYRMHEMLPHHQSIEAYRRGASAQA